MIREYIILLTDKQDAELIRKAEAERDDGDDLAHLQQHINKWLDGKDEDRIGHSEK